MINLKYEYEEPESIHILKKHGLTSFDDIWKLSAVEVEPGNIRRGGWSSVVRLELMDDQQVKKNVYIKRQQNHSTRLPRFCFKKIPTLLKEWMSIQLLNQALVPTVHPLYFAWGIDNNDHKAILVTWELEDYVALEKLLPNWVSLTWKFRKNILHKMGEIIARMHKAHVQHNCLYPKHVFVKNENNNISISIIDLEKCRTRLISSFIFKRDIGTLYKRMLVTSKKERLYFVHSYFGEKKLSEKNRAKISNLLKYINKRTGSGDV